MFQCEEKRNAIEKKYLRKRMIEERKVKRIVMKKKRQNLHSLLSR